MPLRSNARLLVLLASALVGCRALVVAEFDADAAVSPDAAASFCEGEGPSLLGARTCAADLRQHGDAVCACGDIVADLGLDIDAFDSRVGPYTSRGAGASIGSRGQLDLSAASRVHGDMTLVGAPSLTGDVGGALEVSGDFRARANITTADDLQVGGDAAVGGDLRVDVLTVAGTLRLPAAAALEAPGGLSVGTEERALVDVETPCACEAGALDIPALVAAVETDNASITLAEDALSFVGSESTLDLPCGRYRLTGISGEAPLTIRAEGRVALLVDGDLTSTSTLRFDIAEGARLDVFVAGGVAIDGAVVLGDPDRPEAFRLYASGASSVFFGGGLTLGGVLHAPDAAVVTRGTVEVFGALLVGRLTGEGEILVHQDLALGVIPSDCAAR